METKSKKGKTAKTHKNGVALEPHRKPGGGRASDQEWAPGTYVMTREASTAVGPGDLLRWAVKVDDCPGGRMAIMNFYRLNRLGKPAQVINGPEVAGWTRVLEGSGQRYLDAMASSPHVTVTRYEVAPLTLKDVAAFVKAHAGRNYTAAERAAEALFVDHPVLREEAVRRLSKAAIAAYEASKKA